MVREKFVEVFSGKDFRNWLLKNHDNERRVGLIINKKHTGKPFPSHNELLREAICFGWVDTTIKRLDEDKFVRFFVKRSKSSRWSENTLRYAKEMIKEGKMMPCGMAYYKAGLKKKTHDFGIPANPEMPKELRLALNEKRKAKENFERFSPSVKKTYYRWILRAKLSDTKKKRISAVVKRSLGNIKSRDLAA